MLDLDYCLICPFRLGTYQSGSHGGVIFRRGFFQERDAVVIQECITRTETSARANDVVLTECIWRAAEMGVTTKPARSPWQTRHNKLHSKRFSL